MNFKVLHREIMTAQGCDDELITRMQHWMASTGLDMNKDIDDPVAFRAKLEPILNILKDSPSLRAIAKELIQPSIDKRLANQ